MSAVIYSLCALTSVACAWFLLRAYARTRHRLLFWSGLCFVMLTVSITKHSPLQKSRRWRARA